MTMFLNCPKCNAPLIFDRMDNGGQHWHCPACGIHDGQILVSYAGDTNPPFMEQGTRIMGSWILDNMPNSYGIWHERMKQ